MHKYLVGIVAAVVFALVPASAMASPTTICLSTSFNSLVQTHNEAGGCEAAFSALVVGEPGPEGKEGPEGNSINAKSATGAECPAGGANILNENAKKEHLYETDVCNGEKGGKGETGTTGPEGKTGKEGPKGETGEGFTGYELTAAVENSTSMTTVVGEEFGVSGECPVGKKVISVESAGPSTDKNPTIALLGTSISGSTDRRWEAAFVVVVAGTTKRAFTGRAICAA